MIKATYEQIIERISKTSGLAIDEIERRIAAKKAKLSDLVSKEGAAQIVAAELGISFDKQKVKINEVMVGMHKVGFVGEVIKLFPVRSFKTKKAEGKVANMLVGDDTGNIKVVLWDTHHIGLVEEGKVKEGTVIEVKNANVREGNGKEVHLSSFSEFRLSDEKIENVIREEVIARKKIAEIGENQTASFRATVVQAFEPRFFTVCPECSSRLTSEGDKQVCIKHGAVLPQERVLFTMVADDGTSNVRTLFFSDSAKKVFGIEDITQLKDVDFFINKKTALLGKEFVFTGRARQNKLRGDIEVIVNDIKEASPDEVMSELSK